MKNKATLLNMISGLVLQFFTLVSGFILPKIILTCFGSEVNGLVSSLNQFLSYITLVEGGITGVIIANLYKPIVEQDNNKISSVLVTADRFYKKIGALFIGFSREKIEDEMIQHIRLNALMAAMWINYLLLIVVSLSIYNINYLTVMACGMATPLVIFLLVYHFNLYKLNRNLHHEE